MTFAIIVAIAAVLTSLALLAMARPQPRRLPVRIDERDPRDPSRAPRLPPR